MVGRILGIIVLSLLLGACDISDVSTIAVVQSESRFANAEMLAQVAKDFYQAHNDEYDMLVMWSSKEFGPGSSFYLPVKNDVAGIGYQHDGPEFFDNSQSFGSARLEGIIWMGPEWLTREDTMGPTSTLGILAQETAHRWGSTIQFLDEDLDPKQQSSEELLGDPFHWSFFLDTVLSPLGGNQWISLGDSLYQALPVTSVEFSQLDLYLMGLIPADRVDPLNLLVNIRDAADNPDGRFSRFSKRVIETITIKADLREITLDQIVAIEGLRDTAGFNATNIRQAWIYVTPELDALSPADLVALQTLKAQWGDFFSEATDGLSLIDTTLF